MVGIKAFGATAELCPLQLLDDDLEALDLAIAALVPEQDLDDLRSLPRKAKRWLQNGSFFSVSSTSIANQSMPFLTSV